MNQNKSTEIVEKNYQEEYSEDSFWDKVKNYAKSAGEIVLENALKLYYCAKDPDTPAWAKTVVLGALGYFISPIDAIPDVVPAVGFSDDLGVLIAAVATVATNIKDEHVKQAKETLKKWFS